MKKIYSICVLFFGVFYSLAQTPFKPSLTFDKIDENSTIFQNQKTTSAVFIENKGQWQSDVLFCARLNGTNVWITRDGIVYDFYKIEIIADSEYYAPLVIKERLGKPGKTQVTCHVVRMNFTGMTRQANITGKNKQEAYIRQI